MDSIADRIKKIREIRNYTQKVLAEKSGIHEVQIQMYEYGTRTPKIAQLQKIANGLGVDIAFLQPTHYDTPSAIFACLFGLIDAYGDVTFHVEGQVAFIGVKITDNPSALKELDIASDAHMDLSIEDFKKWLINHPPKAHDEESKTE